MWKAIAAWIARQQCRWQAWGKLNQARKAYTEAQNAYRLADALLNQVLRRRTSRAELERLRTNCTNKLRAMGAAKRAIHEANRQIRACGQTPKRAA